MSAPPEQRWHVFVAPSHPFAGNPTLLPQQRPIKRLRLEELPGKVSAGVPFSISHFTWNNGEGVVEAHSRRSCLTAGSGFIAPLSAEAEIYDFILIHTQPG